MDPPSRIGRSPFDVPEATDERFVVDTGGHLDQYLNRDQVPNARLRFPISIGRYYSPLVNSGTVNPDGTIKADRLTELINNGLLPEWATLQLTIFDVDSDYSPKSCREVDRLEVNGRQIFSNSNNTLVELSSGSDRWSRWSVTIPTGYLRFPIAPGNEFNQIDSSSNAVWASPRPGETDDAVFESRWTSPPVPVANEIAIEINAQVCQAWAVEVDWAALVISAPVRPIVFIHGWNETNSIHAWDDFALEAKADGLLTDTQPDLNANIHPVPELARYVAQAIRNATTRFGVDKVNIIAHSRGGIVSRQALGDPEIARRVQRLITLSTPHLGSGAPDLLDSKIGNPLGLACSNTYPGSSQLRKLCTQAADEMTTAAMFSFNYSNCVLGFLVGCRLRVETGRQSRVDYRAFVGANGLGFRLFDGGDIYAREAEYPWDAPLPQLSPQSPRIPLLDAIFSYHHLDMEKKVGVYVDCTPNSEPR